MLNPKGKVPISLYGTSIKPEIWGYFYDHHASTNQINFEIVFAGPKPPDFQLPSNFKYIKATVKPIQCAAIAAHHSEGELLGLMSDDIHLDRGVLDHVYDKYRKRKHNIIALRYYRFFRNFDLRIPVKGTPRRSIIKSFGDIPMVCFYERNLYSAAGGYDKKFRWAEADVDLYLRALQRGGKMVYLDMGFSELRAHATPVEGYNHINNLWYRTADDCNTFRKLWTNNYKVRTSELEPFVFNESICHRNQGYSVGWEPELPKFL